MLKSDGSTVVIVCLRSRTIPRG